MPQPATTAPRYFGTPEEKAHWLRATPTPDQLADYESYLTTTPDEAIDALRQRDPATLDAFPSLADCARREAALIVAALAVGVEVTPSLYFKPHSPNRPPYTSTCAEGRPAPAFLRAAAGAWGRAYADADWAADDATCAASVAGPRHWPIVAGYAEGFVERYGGHIQVCATGLLHMLNPRTYTIPTRQWAPFLNWLAANLPAPLPGLHQMGPLRLEAQPYKTAPAPAPLAKPLNMPKPRPKRNGGSGLPRIAVRGGKARLGGDTCRSKREAKRGPLGKSKVVAGRTYLGKQPRWVARQGVAPATHITH